MTSMPGLTAAARWMMTASVIEDVMQSRSPKVSVAQVITSDAGASARSAAAVTASCRSRLAASVISGVVWSGWAGQVALDLTGRLPSRNRSLGLSRVAHKPCEPVFTGLVQLGNLCPTLCGFSAAVGTSREPHQAGDMFPVPQLSCCPACGGGEAGRSALPDPGQRRLQGRWWGQVLAVAPRATRAGRMVLVAARRAHHDAIQYHRPPGFRAGSRRRPADDPYCSPWLLTGGRR